MNIEAADQFIVWFQNNEERLAALHQELIDLMESERHDVRTIEKIFGKLQHELEPQLTRVEDGLMFEVGPGANKKHGLILSAGGVSRLIPAVQYLASKLSGTKAWEVIAFKPVRGVEGEHVLMTSRGEKRIAASDVFVSLHSEPVKVGVRLYFKDYAPEDEEVVAQAGFNLLDFALGEYVVMESVGEVGFYLTEDAPDDSFPMTELAHRFAGAVDSVRTRYTQLSQMNPRDRAEKGLQLIASDLEKVIEGFDDGAGEDEIHVGTALWSEDPNAEARLMQTFSDFDIMATPKLSAVGNGYQIVLTGSAKRHGLDLREWILSLLGQAPAPVLLTAVFEPEPPNPMKAQFVAGTLMANRQFDEAIRVLRPTIRCGVRDDGTLHNLLGLAYAAVEKNHEAVEMFEKAISLTSDESTRGRILTSKGSALQKSGQLDEAIVSFEEALRLDESKSARQYNLGQAYAQKGWADKACLHLGRALKANAALKEHMATDPDLATLRTTEQYKNMVEQNSRKGWFGSIFRRKAS